MDIWIWMEFCVCVFCRSGLKLDQPLTPGWHSSARGRGRWWLVGGEWRRKGPERGGRRMWKREWKNLQYIAWDWSYQYTIIISPYDNTVHDTHWLRRAYEEHYRQRRNIIGEITAKKMKCISHQIWKVQFVSTNTEWSTIQKKTILLLLYWKYMLLQSLNFICELKFLEFSSSLRWPACIFNVVHKYHNQ